MNKSTQKILILAISAIAVIIAATAAIIFVPKFLAKDDNADKKAAKDYASPTSATTGYNNNHLATMPSMPDVSVPEESTTLPTDVENVTTNSNSGSNSGSSNNSGSNSGSSNNSGSSGNSSSSNGGPTRPTGADEDPLSSINVKQLITSQQFAGYRWSPEGQYYYTDDKECWQSNAGYNEVYDQMTPLTAMFIDCLRVRFNYDNKDWMVQFWKGQYGWLLLGAEIGLYTAPEGENTGIHGDINHYDCAAQEDWLYMQLDCYYAEEGEGTYELLFSRPYAKYWWPTGFVKGQLTKYTAPRSELKVKARITCKDEAMTDAFVAGLKDAGFRRAASNVTSQMVDDTYYRDGNDVWVLWSNLYQTAF